MMMEERRARIVVMLKSERTVKVNSLVEEFNVSIETIRRDLEFLEERDFLKRVYGGAVRKGAFSDEPAYDLREVKNLEAKRAIAAEAAALISDGDTVLFDIGTTCLEVARLLSDRTGITIITNSFMIAKELAGSRCRVFVLGGQLRGGELSLSGFLTSEALEHFNADKAIIGAGGITLDRGITDYHPEEAAVRRLMIEHSKYSIVVADSSKFGVVAMNAVSTLKEIGILVTDSQIPKEIRQGLRKTAVPTITVDV